jgi:hypothetical protein
MYEVTNFVPGLAGSPQYTAAEYSGFASELTVNSGAPDTFLLPISQSLIPTRRAKRSYLFFLAPVNQFDGPWVNPEHLILPGRANQPRGRWRTYPSLTISVPPTMPLDQLPATTLSGVSPTAPTTPPYGLSSGY